MIDKLNHYSLTNPASVYDEEALTALELAGRTAGKVNECVEHFNTLEKETTEHLAKQDEEIPVQIENEVQKHIEDGSFDEAINEYAGDLERRLDNILREGGDSTPEIVDARLSSNGFVYDSLGDAIREQFDEVIVGINKKNLIDVNTLSAGYIQTTGEIHPSHQTTTFYRWEYTTDYIPVTIGDTYALSIKHSQSRDGWYAISTYDENKNFIDRDRTYNYVASGLNRTFTFPEGVSYVRISYRSYADCSIKFEQSEYSTKHDEVVLKNNILDDYPLQFDGYIVDNGSIYPQTDAGYFEGVPALLERYTRHIPVKEGETYTIYHNAECYAWGAVCFYDVNGNGIKRITISEKKTVFLTPEGCVSMMVCARTYYLKDLALFMEASPAGISHHKQGVMTAEQRAFENYLKIESTSENARKNVDYNISTVKSIAHRGWTADAPENTLKAFRHAFNNGFKYVECDVRKTSDGVFVLLHDETVDRTSNGTGKISELTFSEVRALDFGDGEQIPTFEEFLTLCRALGLHPYIELKDFDNNDVDELMTILRIFRMINDTTIISFSVDNIRYVRQCEEYQRCGILVNTADELNDVSFLDSLDGLHLYDKDIFFLSIPHLEVENMGDDFTDYYYPLEVWGVYNEDHILALPPFVSGVTSDNIHAGEMLVEYYLNL